MTIRELWDVSSDKKLCMKVDGDIYGLSEENGFIVASDWRGDHKKAGGRIVSEIVVTAVAGYGTVMLATVY